MPLDVDYRLQPAELRLIADTAEFFIARVAADVGELIRACEQVFSETRALEIEPAILDCRPALGLWFGRQVELARHRDGPAVPIEIFHRTLTEAVGSRIDHADRRVDIHHEAGGWRVDDSRRHLDDPGVRPFRRLEPLVHTRRQPGRLVDCRLGDLRPVCLEKSDLPLPGQAQNHTRRPDGQVLDVAGEHQVPLARRHRLETRRGATGPTLGGLGQFLLQRRGGNFGARDLQLLEDLVRDPQILFLRGVQHAERRVLTEADILDKRGTAVGSQAEQYALGLDAYGGAL